MSLTLASPLSVWPSQVSGEIYINVPVKCVGPAATATIKLYIFEGSILATHGTLQAEYSQQVEFLGGQTKDVLFTHMEKATSQSRRDVGIEIIIDDRVVKSAEFDDVYSAATTSSGMDMSAMMPMIMMVMVMGMVTPMVSGTQEEQQQSEGGI
jgi:hypothetical protein